MKKVTSTVILGLLVGLIVWILSVLKALVPLDGIVYDHLLVTLPILKNPSPQNLLIIQASNKYRMADDKTWLVLLEQIEKQQPKEVVFAFMPTQVSTHFYEEASRYENVIFGRRVEINLNNQNLESLEEWPTTAKGIKLPFGVIRLPSSDNGIFRTQQKQIKLNNQWQPTLEAVVAQRAMQNKNLLSETASFRIDFSPGIDSLPVISIERALSGDLIPELIKSHIVLIGLSDLEDSFVYTPLMTQNVMLTPLLFYGYSLETILLGNEIYPVQEFWSLLLIFCVIVLSFFMFQCVPKRLHILCLIILLCAYTLITWFLLALAKIWLPIVELWVTQVLIWIALTYYRNKSEDIKFQNMIIEMSANLRHKLIPDYFYNTEEPWSKINDMLRQLIHLDWSIFMECDKEKHKLRIVTALGCSPDQMNERISDYRNKPYTTAIEHKEMIKINNLLKEDNKGKQQYLMPLIFLGDIQGFWAFSLPSEKKMDTRLEFFLNSLGTKITELLYHREQWLRQQRLTHNIFFRYLNLQSEQQLSHDFEKIISIAEHRLMAIDDYLDHSSIASIVYDLFGRPLIINKQMLALLKIEKIFPHDMSMLELIRSITEISEEACRYSLQSLMIDSEEELKFDVTLSQQPDKSYVLILSGVNTNLKSLPSDDAQVAQIERQGFLCELIDVTEIKQTYNLKETVREHLGFQFRNDLASIVFASSLLEQDSLPETTRKRLLDILRIKSKAIASILDEADLFLSVKLSMLQLERYPVDSKQVISNAVTSLNEEASRKDIVIFNLLPELTKLVYASSKILEWITIKILKYLLLDGQTGSKITIKAETSDHLVTFTFSNQGFGMPNELFQSYLTEVSTGTEDKNLNYIKEAITIVQSWGGELRGTSEVGVGLTFVLTLKGFL